MDPSMSPSVARALRMALSDPQAKHQVMEALDWDASQVSRFLSGGMGIVEEKIDAAIAAVGFVCVSPEYLDFLAYGSQIGAACRCARSGMGECGKHKVQMKRAA